MIGRLPTRDMAPPDGAIAATYRIAVLGAGVAGGVCASRLSRLPNVATTIYDMGSRGPGGRASCRPVDGKGGSFSPADQGGVSSLSASLHSPLVFDHGVQAFSVSPHNIAVQALVDEWCEAGHVQEWSGRFGALDAASGTLSDEPAADAPFGLLAGRPRYVGSPTMGHVVSGMLDRASAGSASFSALIGCKATKVHFSHEGESTSGARWTVESSDGAERHFDAVVVAGHSASFAAGIANQLPPNHDAAAEEHAAILSAMRRVSYPDGTSPLYALMVAFDEPLGGRAPFDGASVVGSSDLRWISRESSKPRRARADGRELWVALSTEGFALRVADELQEGVPRAQGGVRPTEAQLQTVAQKLLGAMADVLKLDEMPPPAYLHAQRWQAGITRESLNLDPPCAAWEEAGLIACGDWAAASARVEEAARSGLAAADAAQRVCEVARHMRGELFSKTPPPGSERLAARAMSEWPEWKCDAFPASSSGRFQESRWWEARERAAEERCLVTAGRASLWPKGGGPPVEIGAGDWATFRKGFLCTWVVHEPIAKRYAYFDASGEELPP